MVSTYGNWCAPGRIRTCDTGFRRAVLYPLSYWGGRASPDHRQRTGSAPGGRSRREGRMGWCATVRRKGR